MLSASRASAAMKSEPVTQTRSSGPLAARASRSAVAVSPVGTAVTPVAGGVRLRIRVRDPCQDVWTQRRGRSEVHRRIVRTRRAEVDDARGRVVPSIAEDVAAPEVAVHEDGGDAAMARVAQEGLEVFLGSGARRGA